MSDIPRWIIYLTVEGQVHRLYFASQREAENFTVAMKSLVKVSGSMDWKASER